MIVINREAANFILAYQLNASQYHSAFVSRCSVHKLAAAAGPLHSSRYQTLLVRKQVCGRRVGIALGVCRQSIMPSQQDKWVPALSLKLLQAASNFINIPWLFFGSATCLAAMELPDALPDLPAAPHGLRSGVFRGGGGQLSRQAQFILASLASAFEQDYSSVARVLGMPAQVRLPGFLSAITGLDRSVVSRHLQHLLDEPCIRDPVSSGGRKRKLSENDLPTELPDLPQEPPAPIEELFEPEHDEEAGAAAAGSYMPQHNCAAVRASPVLHGLDFGTCLGLMATSDFRALQDIMFKLQCWQAKE